MSQLLAWGGQSIGVSALASVLPKNTEDWSLLEWTGWISLQSKGLSRVFSTPQFKSINSLVFSFLHSPTLTSIHDHWKNHILSLKRKNKWLYCSFRNCDIMLVLTYSVSTNFFRIRDYTCWGKKVRLKEWIDLTYRNKEAFKNLYHTDTFSMYWLLIHRWGVWKNEAWFSSVQFSHSVMSDSLRPKNRSMPGLAVHHQLSEFTQSHVHRVSDAIHPL